jgi:hypothetical protein
LAFDFQKAEAASATAEMLVAARVAAAAEVEGHLAEVGGQLAAVQAELVTARQLAEEREARVRQVEAEVEVRQQHLLFNLVFRVTGTVTQCLSA